MRIQHVYRGWGPSNRAQIIVRRSWYECGVRDGFIFDSEAGELLFRRRITSGLHDHIPCGHTGADKKQPRPERASGTS